MAFGWDGNGSWNSDLFPTQDRDDGIPILASKFDQLIQQNLKQSFPQCMTIDSQTKPIANVDVNNFKVVNVSDATSSKDAVNKGLLDVVDAKTGTNANNINNNASNISDNTTAIERANWAKAIVDSDGTILTSSGIASVVRSATGKYDITLSNAADNTNYLVFLTNSFSDSGAANRAMSVNTDIAKTTTTFSVINQSSNGANSDTQFSVKVEQV